MNTFEFEIEPGDDESWEEVSKLLANCDNERVKLKIQVGGGQRTIPQNSAIHLYLKWLCEGLNDAGFDMVTTLEKFQSKNLEIPWTPEFAKDRLWRPVQVAVTRKESSTDLEKTEVSKVYEVLNRHLSDKLGIQGIPFPDRWGRPQ